MLRLIVGLGNPGLAYRNTRHNAGFQVVDRLRQDHRFISVRGSWQARIGDVAVVLFKPLAFMNRSGPPTRRQLDRLGAGPAELLVIHDDIDLPLGRLRFKPGGGSGGHRGVESVVAALGTDAFVRLKLGIGRPPDGVDPSVFVLEPPTAAEQPAYAGMVTLAARAVSVWVTEGLQAAMQAFHSREDPACDRS